MRKKEKTVGQEILESLTEFRDALKSGATTMENLCLTRRQGRELDRRALEQYGIQGLVLMENAGRGVADYLESLGLTGPFAICCGKGNNAGDGFVVARHLAERSHEVRVALFADPGSLQGDAAVNFAILQKCDVPISVLASEVSEREIHAYLSGAGCVIDALLGTGAVGVPRPPISLAIDAINYASAKSPVLVVIAIDMPSGLDCDSGEPSPHTVRAMHTATLVSMKLGFLNPQAVPWTGQIQVIGLGLPRRLIEEMSRWEG